MLSCKKLKKMTPGVADNFAVNIKDAMNYFNQKIYFQNL